MFIHWFPGHMKKAYRTMQQEMKLVNSVVYVLDSRAPQASINPYFDELIKTKPILYILNKSDLVSQNDIIKWKDKFEKEGKHCLITDSTQKGGSKQITKKLIEINSHTIERFKAKGVNKTIRAMVIGVPNCGKSTLINSLIAKKKTITGNKPGVTKGKQWVVIDNSLELMDTPGTLYPDFQDQDKARFLAFIGCIRDDILDINELATELLIFLRENYVENLKSRYKLQSVDDDIHALFEEIGRKRGFFIKGGDIDDEKTAKAIITDFRKQAFGKIILEKV